MCLPIVTILIILIAFPISQLFFMSLTNWSLGGQKKLDFVGLNNFFQIITQDSRFRNSAIVTAQYTFLALFSQMGAGILLAQFLRRKFRGKKLVLALLFLPWIATPVATASTWRDMFSPTLGTLNFFLRSLNLSPLQWISSSKTVIPSLVLFDFWRSVPFVTVIITAGYSMLPTAPYEAAEMDGANTLQKFIYISLPLLRPIIVLTVVLRLIDILRVFSPIYVLTGGGPAFASEVLYIYIYEQGFYNAKMGYASALAVILFSFILVGTVFLVKGKGKG